MTTPKQKTLPGIPANLAPRPSRTRGYRRGDAEFQMQKDLFEFIRLHRKRYPILETVHSIPNGACMTDRERIKQYLSGLTPGIWDINIPLCRYIEPPSILLPKENPNQGRLIPNCYIELKVGKNGLTKEQKDFRTLTLEYSVLVYPPLFVVAKSWLQAARVIVAYLGIENDRTIQDALRILPSDGKTK